MSVCLCVCVFVCVCVCVWCVCVCVCVCVCGVCARARARARAVYLENFKGPNIFSWSQIHQICPCHSSASVCSLVFVHLFPGIETRVQCLVVR